MASPTPVAHQGSHFTPDSSGAATHRAGKPRNEDSVQVTRVGDTLVALVADGISSGELGDVMSSLAVEKAIASLRAASPAEPRAALERAFASAQAAVLQRKQEEGLPRSGTTLVCAWLVPEGNGLRAHLASIGDSRAYIFRRDGTARQVTEDHHNGERLTYALGFPMTLSAVPGFYTDELLGSGETLLLCSDGLYKVLAPPQIAPVLQRHNARQAAERLVTAARRRGITDNASAVVVSVTAPAQAVSPILFGGIAGLALCLVGLALLLSGWLSPSNLSQPAPTLPVGTPVPQPSSVNSLSPLPTTTTGANDSQLPPQPTREPTNAPPTRTPTPTNTPTNTPTRTPRPPTRTPTTPPISPPVATNTAPVQPEAPTAGPPPEQPTSAPPSEPAPTTPTAPAEPAPDQPTAPPPAEPAPDQPTAPPPAEPAPAPPVEPTAQPPGG